MSDTNIEGDHCRQCEKLEHDLEMANLVNKRLRVSWHEDVNEARKERDEAEAEQNVIRAKYMDICETLSRELSEARAQLKAAQEGGDDLRGAVYGWLGYYRDRMPEDLVTSLQRLLGPLGH